MGKMYRILVVVHVDLIIGRVLLDMKIISSLPLVLPLLLVIILIAFRV